MKLIVLNPNTTRAMTDAVVAEVRRYLPSDVRIEAMTADAGCAVIDSRETFAIGGDTALEMLGTIPAQTDAAILLACFGDPALDRLRQSTTMHVSSLAEAAIKHAFEQGRRFAIVTAGTAWIEMLEERVAECGASTLLAGVFALSENGKQMQANPPKFRAEVLRLSTIAADAGAEILILGGAAFAGLEFELDHRLVSLDPVQIAVGECMEALLPF